MFAYNCDFSVVKNRKAALNLREILPNVMRVHGLIDCKAVWVYLDNLRNAWTKQIITLLMHPPNGNTHTFNPSTMPNLEENEYQDYVEFYHFLHTKDKMTVIDVNHCNELKDLYLFALPPFKDLHRKFRRYLLTLPSDFRFLW